MKFGLNLTKFPLIKNYSEFKWLLLPHGFNLVIETHFETQALIRKNKKHIAYLKKDSGLVISDQSQITTHDHTSSRQDIKNFVSIIPVLILFPLLKTLTYLNSPIAED